MIQLGTVAAVVIYFRADIVRITGAWLRGLTDKQARRDEHHQLTVTRSDLARLRSSHV